MTRRLVLFAAALAAVAVAWITLDRLAQKPQPPQATSREVAATPAQKAVDAPARTPTPAPEAEAPRRSIRRSAAPKADTVAPRPEPSDTSDAATLRINSDVPGASVFIDREFIGPAPVTAERLRTGSHRINVASPGYDGVSETVDVVPGSHDVMIRLKDVRLDAKLDVVHKHRFGSCNGRLAATPQGLRYDGGDKGDAFTVALADLETFDVDYLKKNLRVKLRKGRQYDFTDPEGNADRLFVFHRDVAKAAEKLKAR